MSATSRSVECLLIKEDEPQNKLSSTSTETLTHPSGSTIYFCKHKQ